MGTHQWNPLFNEPKHYALTLKVCRILCSRSSAPQDSALKSQPQKSQHHRQHYRPRVVDSVTNEIQLSELPLGKHCKSPTFQLKFNHSEMFEKHF